jgi:hypothetical protein
LERILYIELEVRLQTHIQVHPAQRAVIVLHRVERVDREVVQHFSDVVVGIAEEPVGFNELADALESAGRR